MSRRIWVALALTGLIGCRLSNQPPVIPSNPLGPARGSTRAALSFTSTAYDSDGDDVAVRFSWGDRDTSPWSSFVPSGQNVTASHRYSSIGYSYVRAQAKDVCSSVSGWSGPSEVHIARPDTNSPPRTPATPVGPLEGARGAALNFTSSSADPDTDDVAIRFSWGDGDTSPWSSFVHSGSSVSVAHVYSSSGPREVRAQACDPWDSVSAWSGSAGVTIDPPTKNHAPQDPEIPTGPTRGFIGHAVSFKTSATDPDTDDVAIRFDWGDGHTSSWSALVKSGTSVTDTHAYASVDTFKVRAQARDSWFSLSNWSDPHSVAILALEPIVGLEIRNLTEWAAEYYIPGYWFLELGGYAVDTTRAIVDSVAVHLKISWFADTLVWTVADSLLPGDSAYFHYGGLYGGQPTVEMVRATGERRLE